MNDTSGYSENDYLMISGMQHYIFCRRQWALIHIEHQWKDNILTIEGDIVHEKCHDELFREKRKNLIVTRGMRVYICKNGHAPCRGMWIEITTRLLKSLNVTSCPA